MIGSFLTRGLIMVFGYAYPAYECYKIVEKNKPEIEQLRFWCQYWILVAMLTVFERVGDTFVSWVPFYSEAKLGLFIYLWFPKTKGTTYVYDSFFRHYVSQHETEIDRNLAELKTNAGDMAMLYGKKAVTLGQSKVFEMLQYTAASKSTSTPTPSKQQQGIHAHEPPPTVVRTREPASATLNSSTGPNEHQIEPAQETDVSPPKPRTAPPVVAAVDAPPKFDALLARESSTSELPADIEEETSKDEPVPSADNHEHSHHTLQDILMDEEEAVPGTGIRLRNTGNNE